MALRKECSHATDSIVREESLALRWESQDTPKGSLCQVSSLRVAPRLKSGHAKDPPGSLRPLCKGWPRQILPLLGKESLTPMQRHRLRRRLPLPNRKECLTLRKESDHATHSLCWVKSLNGPYAKNLVKPNTLRYAKPYASS